MFLDGQGGEPDERAFFCQAFIFSRSLFACWMAERRVSCVISFFAVKMLSRSTNGVVSLVEELEHTVGFIRPRLPSLARSSPHFELAESVSCSPMELTSG